MKIIDKTINFFEVYLNGIILLVMTAIIFVQVVFRFLGVPLKWTEELARFMFVWVIYLSITLCVHQTGHLSVDILPLFFREKGKCIIRIVSDVVGLVFFCLVVYYGLQVMSGFVAHPQYSQATHTNMLVGYLAPYLGAALCVLRYVEDIVRNVLKLKNNNFETEQTEGSENV